jgi:Tn3 transposase DDE domain
MGFPDPPLSQMNGAGAGSTVCALYGRVRIVEPVNHNRFDTDRASGLNLLVAAIILWNTTYLQRAVNHLSNQGHHPASGDLAHLSPLGWEHNLTGDCHWETSLILGPDQFRPLRTIAHDFAAVA